MSNEFERARANLESLIEWYSSLQGNRNEATTRLHLIDTIFFECLGWSKDDVILEESQNKEYADYVFLAPRRVLIVEAKREGNYFELPVEREHLEYSIPSLSRDFANLKSAIEQTTNYCHNRGVPFGAVSNGHQIVAFVATRSDGIPPLDGKALVFPTLPFMLNYFTDLWNALSKYGVEHKKLQLRLIGDSLPELPPKLSTTVTYYPGVKSRNPFQADLQNLSELVIEDLARDKQLISHFLADCYCESGALSQYALISKNILQTRYAALFSSDVAAPATVPARDKSGISPELFAEGLSRRPIILIGDVGVGKTAFIKYLINVEARSVFENVISIYINLGSQATLASDIKAFLVAELKKQLFDEHGVDVEDRNLIRGVYHGDLTRFGKSSIYSDYKETDPQLFKQKEIEFLEAKLNNQEEHLKQVLQHLAKARSKQIVMFIDNADQRDEETQQQAFLISQEIAEHWKPVTVFVSLRPETFYRSLKIGALSGYHAKAFTIAPPRIDRVIEKRLRFALKLANGDIPIPTLSEGIQVQLSSLSRIITIFIRSLDRNENLSEFIDNIAGGNVRLALDLVRSFFGSGHVDTQKIIEIDDEAHSYIIPLHEFLRAVIFGNSEYYEPDQSPIANLFDVSQIDPKEHFLLPILIGFLNTGSASSEEGFVDTNLVYERMQSFGFTPEQIDFALTRGYKKKLLETASRRIPHPGLDMPQSFRVTSVGVYHISNLCRYFVYHDAVLIDTPILDSSAKAQIKLGNNISSRLEAAEEFKNYLDSQWQLLIKEWGATTIFDWADVSVDLQKNIEYIRRRTAS